MCQMFEDWLAGWKSKRTLNPKRKTREKSAAYFDCGLWGTCDNMRKDEQEVKWTVLSDAIFGFT